MRRLSLFIIASASLALSACDADGTRAESGEEGAVGEYTIDRESGTARMVIETPNGDVSMRSGTDLEITLPDGFTIMEGANILEATIIDQPSATGALVRFESDKSPAEIAQYYRAEAEAAGIDIQFQSAINGAALFGGQSPAGTTFSMSASPNVPRTSDLDDASEDEEAISVDAELAADRAGEEEGSGMPTKAQLVFRTVPVVSSEAAAD